MAVETYYRGLALRESSILRIFHILQLAAVALCFRPGHQHRVVAPLQGTQTKLRRRQAKSTILRATSNPKRDQNFKQPETTSLQTPKPPNPQSRKPPNPPQKKNARLDRCLESPPANGAGDTCTVSREPPSLQTLLVKAVATRQGPATPDPDPLLVEFFWCLGDAHPNEKNRGSWKVCLSFPDSMGLFWCLSPSSSKHRK